MPRKDPRVDAYIKRAQPFARPILTRLRKIVHAGCPSCEESIKWQMPFFEYRGPVCFMSAFKQHAAFGFWKSKLLFGKANEGAMGHFGRITAISNLPKEKELSGCVRRAAELNERGIKKSQPRPNASRKITVPLDLKSALAKKRESKNDIRQL